MEKLHQTTIMLCGALLVFAVYLGVTYLKQKVEHGKDRDKRQQQLSADSVKSAKRMEFNKDSLRIDSVKKAVSYHMKDLTQDH